MIRFPLKFFPDTTSFDFIGKRWWAFSATTIMIILSLGLLAVKGLNFGIDFTGGILIEARTEEPADLGKMRDLLSHSDFGEISLQNFGDDHDVMIRVKAAEDTDQAKLADTIKILLKNDLGQHIEFRKVDFVGPKVGGELIQSGAMALLLSFVAMMLYIWFRFEWQYGIGGIAALFHDAIATLGFFAVTRIEFDLTSIAAILTIIGYSINDSVVIYDRIRENMRRYKKMPMHELLNISINETLSRTVLTSTTTLLAVLALALFGGDVIRGFSLSVLWGIIVGTYSSIYVSAPLLIYLNLRKSPEAAKA